MASDPKHKSLVALDVVNLLIAVGIGPYLAVFLFTRQHWAADRVGIAVAATSFVQVVIQTPVGAIVDRIKEKRLLLLLAVALSGLGTLLIVLFPYFIIVIAMQSLMGFASSFFGPIIASISLGLVGHQALARRLGVTRLLVMSAISHLPFPRLGLEIISRMKEFFILSLLSRFSTY